MTPLPNFDPASLPAEQIPAAVAVIGGWLTQLAARQMAPVAAPAPQANDGEDSMLTVEEVAAKLRCSTKKIYRLAKKVSFARKVGSGWLFSRAGLEKWLTRQKA
jgi:excisionase family DNA binding protein